MHQRHVTGIAAIVVGLAVGAWVLRRRRRPQASVIPDIADVPFTADPATEPSTATTAAPTAAAPQQEELIPGVFLAPAAGWGMADMPGPSMPNTKAILFTLGGQPIEGGRRDPTIIFNAEDLSVHRLEIRDYVEKCLAMQVEHAAMLSQGRSRPNIHVSQPCHVGPFSHYVELSLEADGGEAAYSTMYFCVEKTVGLTLQLMTHGPREERWLTAHREMAASAVVDPPPLPTPFTDFYFTRRYSKGVEVKADPMWGVVPPQEGALVAFNVMGGAMLIVFSPNSVPGQFADQRESRTQMIDGVSVSYRDTVTIFTSRTASVVRIPAPQRPADVADSNVAACANSVRPAPSGCHDVFVAVRERISFAIEPMGFLNISLQFSPNSFTYMPLHNPMSGHDLPDDRCILACHVTFDPSVTSLVTWSEMLASTPMQVRPCKVAKYPALAATEKPRTDPMGVHIVVVSGSSMSYCFQWECPMRTWDSAQALIDSLNKTVCIDADCNVS